MKKNVLVFPCGSEIGLEAHNSLHASTHFELYGGSSVDDHGKFVYRNYIGNLPHVGDPDFADQLNDVIESRKIDLVLPAHDSVVLELAQLSAAGKLKCAVITSPIATCEITRSKSQTYQALDGIVPIPRVFGSPQELVTADFPVFLKPDVGQGSKGTHLACTPDEVDFYTKADPTLLILEYLPGKEYTIDCFTDRNGKLLYNEGRERQRIQNGISVHSASFADPRINELAQAINQALAFRGVWFFQVKEDHEGRLVLMEVAPRIAGTMGLARCRGTNLPMLAVFDALGYDLDLFENDYDIVIDRALRNRYWNDIRYDHVYLDFDDLIIFEGKVNPSVMAFVYQCMNNGVKVHLLTKHKGSLDRSLEKYHLSGVFDEIIWIKSDEDKSDHIAEKDAILIDDSFAERKKVHDACGIPVFDSHMVEALMEEF